MCYLQRADKFNIYEPKNHFTCDERARFICFVGALAENSAVVLLCPSSDGGEVRKIPTDVENGASIAVENRVRRECMCVPSVIPPSYVVGR